MAKKVTAKPCRENMDAKMQGCKDFAEDAKANQRLRLEVLFRVFCVASASLVCSAFNSLHPVFDLYSYPKKVPIRYESEAVALQGSCMRVCVGVWGLSRAHTSGTPDIKPVAGR